MFLGIEIGGTKLQLGVSSGAGLEFTEFCKLTVDPRRGAAGIREQIASTGRSLIQRHQVRRIGIGFGGPVDTNLGITTKSHQIDGWEEFALSEWCLRELGVPAVLGNDCDAAALAEAEFGAGRGKSPVFYVTVGTGVGGGCVIDGRLLGRGRPAIAEIGHLRPGTSAVNSHDTVEAIASGWGIVATARALLENADQSARWDSEQLLQACGGDVTQLTAQIIAEFAKQGNSIACRSLDRSMQTLGWAIAQTVTLLAPQVVVVGGGVSQMGEEHFFKPVREYARRFVFPPLASSFEILPATLGEPVVVYGAVALAKQG